MGGDSAVATGAEQMGEREFYPDQRTREEFLQALWMQGWDIGARDYAANGVSH
jgi:hypothetical protein